ncbi:MAG: TPM domain-containing protein [Acutalibacteraceae bacterium]
MMKSTKRLTALLTAMMLIVMLVAATIPASAYEDIIYDASTASGDRRVFDFAELFYDEEEQDLESLIDKAQKKTDLDIVIVTVNSTHGLSDMAYADDFYDYNGFGFGKNYDGVLLLINMDERTTWISTCGAAIDYLNDSDIESITDDITSELKYSNNYEGAKSFIKGVESQVRFTVRLFGLTFTPLSFLVSLIVAFLVGFFYNKKVKKDYKFTGVSSTFDYKKQGHLNLTNQSDILVDTRVTTTKIQSSSGGSGGHSSTHHSSSGRSHGGGGGRF